jgi:RimJ/RimL family protein N-acetyltransferase
MMEDKRSDTLRLHTTRLELIAANREIVQADRYARNLLPGLLSAAVPAEWPPPLNDNSTLGWILNFMASHPDATGWSMWYFVLNSAGPARVAIGLGGFRGAPMEDGVVEVGYSLLEEYQRNGFATEATNELVRWAFDHPAVRRVAAETYPHLRQSIRVLEKSGFSYIGENVETLTIRFELTREDWQNVHSSKYSSS